MIFLETVLSVVSLVSVTQAWKTCDKVPFCNRLRSISSPKAVLLSSLSVTNNTVHGNLHKNHDATSASLTITALENEIFRIIVDDVIPSKPPRRTVSEALDGVPKLAKRSTSQHSDNCVLLDNGKSKAVIYTNPFTVEIYSGSKLVSIINAKQRLAFEASPPNTSVALDIRFPGAEAAYGLPLHADRLALRTTSGQEPYRLFNVDYYAYKVESTEALYGSIPVLYAHGTSHSSGIFWLNSAQTWVDLSTTSRHIDAYFMSESGLIDAFILTGPTLPDTVKQYSKLTGTAPLPQYFTLGYHQSRYSYMTQEEVEDVVDQFNSNRMPVDVVWLDIEYTSGKKYFTWNPVNFSNPIALQNHLEKQGKKLVVIIDPHIKNETGYFVHDGAVKNNYYMLNRDGSHYVGTCWPGPSAYLDLTNPKAIDYYASFYQNIDTFQSKIVHIWNDMNEPSVFYTLPSDIEEYEKTVPLDLLHYGNYEHRDVHNIYGLLQTISTKKGVLSRANNSVRPFILTRSHFAGSQRYAAIWTGDNSATWEHLQISIPMCLSEALAGISFCGADVGGFSGIPTDELYQRWFQAGAWLPFFRGHSDISTPRREPYRFSKSVKTVVLKSLQQRYAHLPVWYTLFHEHEKTGEPVIRPISYHYPKEAKSFGIDNAFLIGADILSAPVLQPNASLSRIYLPGGKNEIWYNIDNSQFYHGNGFETFDVNIQSIPIFYRGGSIIFRKDTPRMSTLETYNDPFTIYIIPDIHGFAGGRVYIDDYETFEYKKSEKYIYSKLKFTKNKIALDVIHSLNYKPVAAITKIILLHSPEMYRKAIVSKNGEHLDISHNAKDGTFTIHKCSLNVDEPFEIKLL